MEEILEKLSQTTGVIGCFITGLDGLVVASKIRSDKDQDLLAATTADLFRSLGSAFEKLDDGKTVLLTIERTNDKIFIYPLENMETILVVLSEPKINLGLIRMELQEALKKLKNHF
jgi:predicted regulator of Ras-like GTPase activity (Roadblock/LC7/MglB family)